MPTSINSAMENELNSIDPEILVGLDIGTTKIACFVGQRNEHGKIEILGYGKSESVGVSRGVVSNIDRTVQSIKAAVKAAEEDSGVEIKLVNVGIAGQHIKSLQHRGMITREETEDEIAQTETYDEESLHMRQLLKTRLIDMDLSVRALNCLKAAEVDTLGDLVSFNKTDLMKFRNFGKKSLTELEELVLVKGLNFGMDLSKYKLDKE